MKRKMLTALAGGLLIAAIGPAQAAETATATMRGPNNEPRGTVTFTQGANGLIVSADLEGLPEGPHGLHIHETGACAPDFGAAGGHYNPEDRDHGIMTGEGRHAGDLPNIHADGDGEARADFFTDALSLTTLGKATLFDGDGSAVIVHAEPDSYGAEAGAGARIACGVITR